VVVHLLLLIGDVNIDKIGVLRRSVSYKRGEWDRTYLGVAHFYLLLLKGISGFGFAVIEGAVYLFAPTLHLLADAIVLSLLFAQLGILAVAFLLQLGSVVCVELTKVFVSRAKGLEGVCQLGDESTGELFVFRRSGFQCAQLNSPGGHRSAETLSENIGTWHACVGTFPASRA